MLRTIIVASLVGLAAAECPNACSGHGSCGKFDMCSCYDNWQANDCSQRTCPYDLAHVDTPKGDLNNDRIFEDGQTVLEGSTVYPYGTTEQFPDMENDSAHYYMECSNKGLCDRTTGECACFDGYEGTACQRAACPNDCSGHGTCETIRELSGDVVYMLWDHSATMGCSCDSGYGAADCSERACKYGVDPLYIDDTVGRYTEVSLTFGDTPAGDFAITFYDVHGESYETTPITYSAGMCVAIQEALVALPNDVLYCNMAEASATIHHAVLNDCVVCANVGTEYILGFPNNPGYLKVLEVVTVKPGVFLEFSGTIVVNTVSIGEFVDNFATKCDISDASVVDGLLATLAAEDVRTLKKCLGDADGIDTSGNNVEVYNWDLGTGVHPHVIKLVYADEKVEFGFAKGALDGAGTRVSVITTLATFTDAASVDIYATDGVATILQISAANAEATVAEEGSYVFTTTASLACADGATVVSTCLQQGDTIFITAWEGGDVGENQLFTVVRIATIKLPGSTVYEVEVDYPLLIASGDVVKFEAAATGAYEYVSQCSNRGTCDSSSGLCQCFKGYTNDDCSVQSALAV